MLRRRPPRFLFLLLLFTSLLGVEAWYDENCGESGQCTIMFNSYQDLIRGEGCRSFYYTGKCSRICTYSLKSLVRRHTWSRCAERCEWSKASMEAIASWLDMCLANPAPDVFEPEDTGDGNKAAKKGDHMQEQMGKTIAGKSHMAHTIAVLVGVLFAVILAVFCAIVAVGNPTFKVQLRTMIAKALRSAQKLQLRWTKRKPGSRGMLDGSALDREELRNLQRGARRHLKAMRSNLD